jgi:hypothetical protein
MNSETFPDLKNDPPPAILLITGENINSQPPVNTTQNVSIGLCKYLDKWTKAKIDDNERLVKDLWAKYQLLRNAGQYNEARTLHRIIRKMNRCRHNLIESKLKGNPSRKEHHPYYCNNKLCPICYPYRSYRNCLEVFSRLLTLGGTMYGVYTFSPKNPKNDQLKNQLTKFKTVSQKVFNRQCKNLSKLIDGSIRFLGLTYSHHGGFNTHMHILLRFSHRLTESEIKDLYGLLNERFKKFTDVEIAEDHLGVYEYSLENIKRTASYLTKYSDHQTLSLNISHMDIETYKAFQDAYSNNREFEFTGCYRYKLESSKF